MRGWWALFPLQSELDKQVACAQRNSLCRDLRAGWWTSALQKTKSLTGCPWQCNWGEEGGEERQAERALLTSKSTALLFNITSDSRTQKTFCFALFLGSESGWNELSHSKAEDPNESITLAKHLTSSEWPTQRVKQTWAQVHLQTYISHTKTKWNCIISLWWKYIFDFFFYF